MDNLERLTTLVTQDTGTIKNGQSRETDNIGHTRGVIKNGQSGTDNQTQGQSRMDNLETLTTLVTQDTGAINNGQSRETDNIDHTRHRGDQEWTI